MNILCIAPHPDDESIGCGGTLRLHANRGDRVTVVFLTSGELGLDHLPREEAHSIREAEATRACEILGVAKLEFMRFPDWFTSEHTPHAASHLDGILAIEKPARIYLPHPDESHPDHKAALPIVRATGYQAELYAYEVWTPLTRAEECEDIGTVLVEKLRAIRCYTSQLATYRYDRAARGLAQYRGILHANCRYAEAFESLEI
jgi:LmbE family N-acetylglucosaminyl deacetylase